MSLILDALKKLEQEKAARKDGAVNIATEILRMERPQRRRKGSAFLAVAAVGAGLAVFAVLALREGTGVLKPPPPPAPTQAPAASRAAMPAPLPSPPPPPKPAELPAAQPPADIGKGELPPPPAKPREMPPSPPPAKPVETPLTRPRAVSRPQPAAAAANKERETPENSANGSAARLRVSGIVWQEERSARRAFINGNIASEGSVIDGARIVEIYPGRIRFSREGKWFDVPLEKNP